MDCGLPDCGGSKKNRQYIILRWTYHRLTRLRPIYREDLDPLNNQLRCKFTAFSLLQRTIKKIQCNPPPLGKIIKKRLLYPVLWFVVYFNIFPYLVGRFILRCRFSTILLPNPKGKILVCNKFNKEKRGKNYYEIIMFIKMQL